MWGRRTERAHSEARLPCLSGSGLETRASALDIGLPSQFVFEDGRLSTDLP